MVDEEGRFTPAAGADLQGQSVLEEGNATGKKTQTFSSKAEINQNVLLNSIHI